MKIDPSVDMMAVLRRIADQKIDKAMEEGKFDNLEGMGKPLDLEPLPADENARAMYWAVRLMKQANVVPEQLKEEAKRHAR